MKQDIFSRYERYGGNRLAIDVSVGRIEELFEDFDSAASYIKKDLDQDLVDYLIDSVQEIRRNDFVIRINLPDSVQEKHRERVRKSMKNYFRYLELLQWRKLRKMLWKSLLLFGLGMFLLTVSIVLQGNSELLSDMIHDLVTEGLTVAAWVSLWSSFAILIFEFTGTIADIRIYRRIASREVIFKSSDSAATVLVGAGGKKQHTAVGNGQPG